jgi:murein DD-endopeptidase MepM/ murein hydrolase activator NlpD
MNGGRWTQMRRSLQGLFPERALYLRQGGAVRVVRLTSTGQAVAAGVATAVLAWTTISTGVMAFDIAAGQADADRAPKSRAYYERLIADRQARLAAATSKLASASGSLEGLARAVEKRHEALALLISDLRGQPAAAAALAPTPVALLARGRTPAEEVQAVQADQERLAAAAEDFAKTRADRLRLAMRMAGLEPTAAGAASRRLGVGGPAIEGKDPRALAAVMDVDVAFAERIQHAVDDMGAARSLSSVVKALPLGEPVWTPRRSSGFGVRRDPFDGHAAFHAGQDFAGGMQTPILATAPGVVAFVGQRTGYGNVVEIDHGSGFKTRYAHLAGAAVAVGQSVKAGDRIGAMGSTGRSTGPHLHYEVWRNGRVEDPARFLKAGEYVQQVQRS